VVPPTDDNIPYEYQRFEEGGTSGTGGTTEKSSLQKNPDHRGTDLRNSLALYVPQVDPYRCHVCAGRETSDRPLIPVLSAKPDHPHWLHRACHDEHVRRIDERVALALASSVSVLS
jgi:hypothetical protein